MYFWSSVRFLPDFFIKKFSCHSNFCTFLSLVLHHRVENILIKDHTEKSADLFQPVCCGNEENIFVIRYLSLDIVNIIYAVPFPARGIFKILVC